jgi:pyruvate kinase
MNETVVRRMTELGVHLFRLNMSHTLLDDLPGVIGRIRSWTDVPISLDSEGAQLRNGPMQSEMVEFTAGDMVTIHSDPVVGDAANLYFNPVTVEKQFKVGDEIQVDFNHVRLKITEAGETEFIAEVLEGGVIGSNKAADLNREIAFEPLTEKDKTAIKIGRQLNIMNFAMSFTNRAEDVAVMRAACGPDATIIYKIESPAGLRNLNGILDVADEILIDRGDLSRRVPIEQIPFLQRRIISLARSKGKAVYVATNLLETMVTTKSPSRAELNDVVSTMEMGANGLVLAAETAVGGYPVEAVMMVCALIKEFTRWTPNTSIEEILDG